jgi:hypothetical protein
VFLDDALDIIGLAALPDSVRRWVEDVRAVTANLDNWDGSWLAEGTEADSLRELVDGPITSALGDQGLSVIWDDGYTIFRVTGGPLAEDG